MKSSRRSNFLIQRFGDPFMQSWLAVGLFAVTVLFVHHGRISALETAVFYHIYHWPDFLLPFFFAVTQIGNVYLFFVLAGLLFVRRYYLVVIRLLLSGLLAYLLAGVAKDLIGRGRPLDLLLDVTYRDYIVRGSGFPSGHTALATAVALTLSGLLPRKLKWLVPVMIVSVGLSRIYLGVHTPLDIVGGIAIGWGSYALFQNVGFKAAKKPKSSIKEQKA